MPKMKTHKGSKKRFRVTANGKLKRRQAGKKHLLSGKTGKRKRHLREIVSETDRLAKKYIKEIAGEAKKDMDHDTRSKRQDGNSGTQAAAETHQRFSSE